MNSEVRSNADAAFKRQGAETATRSEYEMRNAAIDANMMRLRAERLAREAAMAGAGVGRSIARRAQQRRGFAQQH